MAIQVVEFSSGGIKLECFLPKNQHTQRKCLNFENWIYREPQKLSSAKIRVFEVDYFDFYEKKIEKLVSIRCLGNCLPLLGFWSFRQK